MTAQELLALFPLYKFCLDTNLTFNFLTLAFLYHKNFYSRQNQDKFSKFFCRACFSMTFVSLFVGFGL